MCIVPSVQVTFCMLCIIEFEDSDFKPPEAEMDEYHPKASRTLFVGNLNTAIDSDVLYDVFKEFGEILVNGFIK